MTEYVSEWGEVCSIRDCDCGDYYEVGVAPNDIDRLFCARGLRKWVIPPAARVRLHVSTTARRGWQRSRRETRMGTSMSEKFRPDGDYLWWYPEVWLEGSSDGWGES